MNVKIKITRSCIVNGKPVEKGKTVSVEKAEARMLIGIGKAVAVKSSKKKETAAE